MVVTSRPSQVRARVRQASTLPLVDPDGARPAGSLVTALFRAGESHVLTQGVQEADTGFQVQDVGDAVDDEVHFHAVGPSRLQGGGLGDGY